MAKNIFSTVFLLTAFQIIAASVSIFTTFPTWIQLLQGCFTIAILSLLLILIIEKSSLGVNKKYIAILVFLIMLSRSAIGILNELFLILPNLPDILYYHNLGIEFSRILEIQGSGIGAGFYGNLVVGISYIFFGSTPLLLSVVNAFFYSVSVIILILIGRNLNLKNLWLIPLFALAYPSSFFYIPVMLRESLFLFTSLLFFYWLIQIFVKKNSKVINYCILFTIILAGALIRPQVFPIYFAIFIVFLVYYHRNLVSGFTFISLLGLGAVLMFTEYPIFRYLNVETLNLHYFQVYRNAFSDFPNAYLTNVEFSNWLVFILYIPRFIFYYLFTPFPWIAGNYQYLIATLDALFMLGLGFATIVVLLKNRGLWHKHIVPIVLLFLLLTAPFAIIEAYPVGAVRHRMIVAMLMFPFAAHIFPYSIRFTMAKFKNKKFNQFSNPSCA